MMSEYNNLYIWDGNLYKSDIVRGAIRPKVNAVGKLVAKHIRTTIAEDGGKKTVINPDAYIRFLLEEPNPYMTGQKFQEKMETQLCLNGNAFALIARDDNGYPVGLYPINASTVEAIYDNAGDLYLKFYFENGKIYTFTYADILHLRGDFGPDNDIFGSSPVESLTPLMEIVGTTDRGIVNAIKNSGVVKWLLKFAGNARPEDIKNLANEFADAYLTNEKSIGVAAVNSTVDAQQIEPKDYVPNAAQMDRTTTRIYSSLNTNSKIVMSSFTEDEWNSYYESQIEPDVRQWGDEMTRKLFTRRERAFGNAIVYEASSLTIASMSTKLNLVNLVDRGIMTPNEVRTILNLAPIPGGDQAVRRLDTAPIDEKEVIDDAEN
ncbi:MAG TPA: phage portal protein [Candidatus Onthovicinus excrementipullorum]|nr:phage portal protein [Candidatus Onthovicinus excrementipullorum]